jgi:replicative DNA helicase
MVRGSDSGKEGEGMLKGLEIEMALLGAILLYQEEVITGVMDVISELDFYAAASSH